MSLTSAALGHSATSEVRTPWQNAFRYLSDPINIGKWALGCWDAKPTETEGIYSGTSLFSGCQHWFRVESNRDLQLIDCYVGTRESQTQRISIRVIRGDECGREPGHCLVTINAWRNVGMDNARWHQLCVSHELEVLLVKSLLERNG